MSNGRTLTRLREQYQEEPCVTWSHRMIELSIAFPNAPHCAFDNVAGCDVQRHNPTSQPSRTLSVVHHRPLRYFLHIFYSPSTFYNKLFPIY
ncbi:hypothetical protein T01_14397 [Trichinella spiralis]|uniref:Uncharacterized protein n=1 Tax=Trichinella spiralis TaxID=6334 RepID=A0A0V1B7Z8_TRISP|nr:hypothetical protein T01_14397 [Trichinella spiralis]